MIMSDKPKKMSYRQKQSLTFIEQDDPPFLQKMKEKLGYRVHKIEDKFEQDESKDDDKLDRDDIQNMREEDRPQIVVLNPGTDISAEELDVEIEKAAEEEDRKKIMEGKIVFRKPEKRISTDDDSIDSNRTSCNKRLKETSERCNDRKQNVNSKRLLSFRDDYDE